VDETRVKRRRLTASEGNTCASEPNVAVSSGAEALMNYRASTFRIVSVSTVLGVAFIACSSSDAGKTDNGGSGGTQTANSGGSNEGGSAGATGGSSASGGGMAAGTGGSNAAGGTGGSGGAVSNQGGKAGSTPDAGVDAAPTNDKTMTFFVTSKGKGKGGDLGGLDGADAHCKALAMAVSPALGNKTWRAYLSTSTVNAVTRIGNGPWYNAKGVMIAKSVQELHDNQAKDAPLSMTWPSGAAAFDVIVDEKGEKHANSVHDILTGSTAAGMVDGANHCNNWTSQTGMAANGHSNRDGGMRAPSWNAAHTVGCGSELGQNGMLVNYTAGTVTSGGGRGSFYCFVP
jgi:hypothetical protein